MTYQRGQKVLLECIVMHHAEGDPHGVVSVRLPKHVDVWDCEETGDIELDVPEPLLYTLSDL